ncbi:MAG: class II aldolase/adducin family protein [Armatimonadota bacterium]|nr:class II aldolase/adducin family protein [Armatimonadota bacterium]
MTSESQCKQDLCEVGRRVWLRHLVAANDGNFSCRLENGEILCTPAGVSKGFLTPEMICKVDLSGKQFEGSYQPSTEIKIHLEVYRLRPDVHAVVHAHPPTATGFAAAGLSLQEGVLPEVIVNLGGVPLSPYAPPGSAELPEALKPYIARHDAFLLANHGAVTLGPDLFSAYYRMETVEHSARVLLTAHLLGGARALPTSRLEELYAVRERLGSRPPPDPPECPRLPSPRIGEDCSAGGSAAPRAPADEDLRTLVERITAEVLRQLRGN